MKKGFNSYRVLRKPMLPGVHCQTQILVSMWLMAMSIFSLLVKGLELWKFKLLFIPFSNLSKLKPVLWPVDIFHVSIVFFWLFILVMVAKIIISIEKLWNLELTKLHQTLWWQRMVS